MRSGGGYWWQQDFRKVIINTAVQLPHIVIVSTGSDGKTWREKDVSRLFAMDYLLSREMISNYYDVYAR